MKWGMLEDMIVPILSVVIAAVPLPTVDKGVEPIELCRIAAVGFSTGNDGWASDYCGRILRTFDGGRSWSLEPELARQWMGPTTEYSAKHIQAWLWLSAKNGFAFVYGAQQVFRTDDGGRRWTASPLLGSSSEMIYALEHVGNRIWYCGSSGSVTVSKDGGRTWARQTRLFQEAAPNPSDWCSGISFLDERNGWVSGWRSLYATTDGGESWTPLKPLPVPASLQDGESEVRGVVRLTPEIAWARTGNDTLFVTKDGGRTWNAKHIPVSEPSVSARADGRLVLTRAPAARLEDAVPIAIDQWTARATAGTANEDLQIYERGKLVRAGPAVTAGTGDRAELRGTRRAADALWGWHMSLVFRSDDDGRSWYRLGGAAEPLDRLEVLTSEKLLGRAGQTLFASEDGGRTWRKTADAYDKQDWERLSGESMALRPWERVDCVLVGPSVLDVEFGVQGCFGSSTNSLHIELDGRESHVSGTFGDWDPVANRPVRRNVNRNVTADEGRALMKSIVNAAKRAEESSGCSSTNHTLVTLRWNCGQAPRGQAVFDTYACGDDAIAEVGALTRSGIPSGYARAIGISEAAKAALGKVSARAQ